MKNCTLRRITRFRFVALLAALTFALVTGCGESGSEPQGDDEASDQPTLTGAMQQAQDRAKEVTDKATRRTEQAMEEVSREVREAVERAEKEGTEVSEQTREKLVRQAEEIYSQAKNFIDNNRTRLADQALQQLQDIKAQLPPSWREKIDQLQQQLDEPTGGGENGN